MPTTTKGLQLTVPANGDNIGGLPAATTSGINDLEAFVVFRFANAATRNSRITYNGAGGTQTAALGMVSYLVSPGRFEYVSAISGSTVTWSEWAPIQYYYSQVKSISNVTSAAAIGAGSPPASGGFGSGSNGPTVPIGGVYSVSVLVQWSGVIPSGVRSYVDLQVNNAGVPFTRGQVGDGENFGHTAGGPIRLNAGDELTTLVYQASGATMTASVTWFIARIGP